MKINVLGLIANGGLIELKFQVLDADKASALFGDVEDMPKLAVEGIQHGAGVGQGMKHQLVLLDGASYFFLYTNVGNMVHDGSIRVVRDERPAAARTSKSSSKQ